VALDLSQQPFAQRRWPRPTAVHAASQGPDGILWLGSRSGLTRFDGARFVEVNLSSGRAPWVRRVLVTRRGVVWMAVGAGELEPGRGTSHPAVLAQHGEEAALLRLVPGAPPASPDRLRRFSALDGLPDPWVWALAEDPSGAIWIGTEGGLARFADDRFQRFTTADGLPSDFVTAFAVGVDGTLYVGTRAGVAVRREGRFVSTAIREPVVALAVDRAGWVWAATADRVLRLDRGGHVESFPAVNPTALAVDLDDNVWVTNSRQVFVGGKPVSHDNEPTGFATSILVDREGSVWLSIREGEIVQLKAPRVRNFGPGDGLSGTVAFSLTKAGDGTVIVATNGGVSRYAGGAWRPWLSGGAPRSMAWGPEKTPTGGLWIGTETELLHEGPRGLEVLRRLPDWPGPKLGGFFSIVPARNGGLWIAQWWRGLLHFPDGDARRPPTEILPEAGLCGDKLTNGLETADGSIWFGVEYGYHQRGVTRVQNGRARCYGASDGLPPVEIGALAEDQEGTLWLGTGWGSGLVRFRDERFVTIPAAAGLPSASITGLLDDGRGHLWIGSEVGVWRVPKADLHRCADGPCAPLGATTFGRAEGMESPECTAAFQPNMVRDDEGNVWVATLRGLSVFPPPERTQRAVVTPAVEEISLDGVPVAREGVVRMGPRQRDLVVRYTAASFVDAVAPPLRHRLHGFEPDWVPDTLPATVHYRDLPPGRYTLDLRAGGASASLASIAVVVEPPLWRSRSFLALLATLVIGAALALHGIRVGRLNVRHRAVADERLRMSRDLHDGVSQKLRAIGLLSDRVRLEARDPQTTERLMQMRQIVHETEAEIRRAIWDMHEVTGEQRLERVVERVLSEVEVPPEIKVSFQTFGASRPVSGLVIQEARLVIKEAFTNAVRHAQAKSIAIGVLSDEEGLHVWVRDDGCGLVWEGNAGPGGGFGVVSMHERARRIGGRLTINGQAGRGTDVSLFVPANARAERS
jgi:signal transduction histidine kinase/ligand-binding sensor domain-containing protein